MGRRRIAGDGSGAGALEGNPQRDFTERLFDRLFAGGGCREGFTAGLGMAPDVLDWRAACPAGALYSYGGAGIGGLEAASPPQHRAGSARPPPRMETLPL